MKYEDHPLLEVAEHADRLIKMGADVYQKFTCAGCGQRLTMEKPNVFYKTGVCDRCPTITNIEERGCNMLVHKIIEKPPCPVCGAALGESHKWSCTLNQK
jgi:hypothetical protein